MNQDLTFKSNYVHDNGGPGLWADTNNINTTFDGNTISNNWGPGIYDEISYNAPSSTTRSPTTACRRHRVVVSGWAGHGMRVSSFAARAR